ncbi:MAG: hypothetical protein AAB649_06400, partial [Patescibacteria group bacterium]
SGVSAGLSAMGLAMPGWGTAAMGLAVVGKGIISFFSGIFSSIDPPPPPEIAGFEWKDFVDALVNEKFINDRMAEVSGSLVAGGNVDTARLPGNFVSEIGLGRIKTTYEDQMFALRRGTLSGAEKRRLSLFVSYCQTKLIAEWTEPRDYHLVAALASVGAPRALLRRLIEYATMHEMRQSVQESGGQYVAAIDASVSKDLWGTGNIPDKLLYNSSLRDWKEMCRLVVFPVDIPKTGDKAFNRPLLTPEFVEREIAYYAKWRKSEVFRLVFPKIGSGDGTATVNFTVKDMPRMIQRGLELAAWDSEEVSRFRQNYTEYRSDRSKYLASLKKPVVAKKPVVEKPKLDTKKIAAAMKKMVTKTMVTKQQAMSHSRFEHVS